MAKILLVEDDNNLRDIYQARLAAEGYEIITAADGELALATAVKEKPDLIVSDVMMPKVSGFEMLDILRGTAGVQNTKVIMMTALSQAEDRARAEKLGADRYLVKSQVTLEDMVKMVKEVLGSDAAPAASTTPADPAAATTPPVTPTVTTTAPATPPPTSDQSPEQQVLNNAANALNQSAATDEPNRPGDMPLLSTPPPVPTTTPGPASMTYPDAPKGESEVEDDSMSVARKKVIKPINDLSKPPVDLNSLLEKEEAKEAMETQQNADAASATQFPPPPPSNPTAPTDPSSISL